MSCGNAIKHVEHSHVARVLEVRSHAVQSLRLHRLARTVLAGQEAGCEREIGNLGDAGSGNHGQSAVFNVS